MTALEDDGLGDDDGGVTEEGDMEERGDGDDDDNGCVTDGRGDEAEDDTVDLNATTKYDKINRLPYTPSILSRLRCGLENGKTNPGRIRPTTSATKAKMKIQAETICIICCPLNLPFGMHDFTLLL